MICNTIGPLRLPDDIHWIFLTMHRASPEVGEWLTREFQNIPPLNLQIKDKQPPSFGTKEGKIQAPPSTAEEELKAAAPAEVHAHAAGG